MHSYLEQNNLMLSNRGFALLIQRPLPFLANKLRANMDEGRYTGIVLTYLQMPSTRSITLSSLNKLNAIGIEVDDYAGSWSNPIWQGQNK